MAKMPIVIGQAVEYNKKMKGKTFGEIACGGRLLLCKPVVGQE